MLSMGGRYVPEAFFELRLALAGSGERPRIFSFWLYQKLSKGQIGSKLLTIGVILGKIVLEDRD